MPAFQFQALDATGRSERGVLQADTARAARSLLRERGLIPLEVEPVAAGARVPGAPRLGAAGRVVLTRQLATLVRAGLPLDEALAALADGATGPGRAIALALRARVGEGATLAQALDGFPQSFDTLYRASVAAGERSGRLDRVLLRLAAHLESRDALRRKVVGALAYPALLLAVALLVVAGLMLYVVPEVTGVFARSGQALPWPTRLLMAASDLLRAGWPWLLGAALVAGTALAATWRRPGFAGWRARLLLRVPGVRRLAVALDTARFARTLAMLGAAAVPLLDALRLSTATVANASLRAALEDAARQVREGLPLSRALARDGRFPAVALRLVASGERAGRLDEMLDAAADQLERELDTTLSVATAALGPAVILAVGAAVLFIVLAVLLPIFELNRLVG
ncbi:type II secretion system F family protein [Coralloluteibacterium thermophilus]|uniref:General secretion pathway protein F n=1 Tax=Coralloluteibacterium thermophilum TaxID=2707049 RepID=A0ABV9NGB9_9GAMM